MTAKFLNIQSKPRTNPMAVAQLEDFQYVEGENIDSKIIINSPNISLYCLEPASQQAIFVETPVEISDYPYRGTVKRFSGIAAPAPVQAIRAATPG